MEWNTLVHGLTVNEMHGVAPGTVTGLAYHTRQVKAGSLFVAIPGHAADGHDFIPAAVVAGAVAIVSSRRAQLPDRIAHIVVPDARVALAQLAAQWYAEPSRHVRLVGVTGTNGKTTITYLLESIWRAAGRRPGVLGTINIRYGKIDQPAPTTTPESLDLQQVLHAMVEAHVDDVVMEVSSHALDQGRVLDCHFDGAIFTNLTQDHLDYHGTMERYGAAKRRLFHEILPASAKAARWAVVNADDPAGAIMAEGCPVRMIRYGLHTTPCDVYAAAYHGAIDGITMDVVTPGGRLAITSRLCGRFNASNLLASVAAAHAMGLRPEAIQQGIQDCHTVPGRLEPVPNRAGLTVLVDYAHTPDALHNILLALRELHPKRVITVFGCGGDRDPGKRSLMGVEVARGSDLAIVTSDNPRTEDPMAIISQILPGLQACRWKEAAIDAVVSRQSSENIVRGSRCEVRSATSNIAHGTSNKTSNAVYYIIPDRREAIHAALRMARRGDVVVIAGKGHEDYQVIGTEKRHFDDREVVEKFFSV